jgi:hypothetical protein
MATSQAAQAEQQEIIQTRDAKIAEIQGYVDLTEEAKGRRINEVRQWAQSEVHAIQEEDRQKREARLASTKKAVLSIPTGHMPTVAEEAQVYAAFRQAWDLVLGSTEMVSITEGGPESAYVVRARAAEKLGKILDQAERVGDSLMARAAFHRAIDLGVQEVVDRYLSTRPDENRKWEAYVKAQEEMNRSQSFGYLLADVYTEQQLNG